MSLFKEILSSLDTTASATSSAPSPVSRQPSGSPKPAARPAGSANSASEPPPLKRKASGPIENAQIKIQRKDAPTRPGQTNGVPRAAAAAGSGGIKPNPSTTTITTTTVPYRGTAGLGAPKPSNMQVKKSNPLPTAQPKAAVPASKPLATKPAAPNSGSAGPAPAKKVGGYMAMLQKAKEKDQTKPPAPPVKHEPTKIMTKKDRELARLQARAAAKGKKPVAGLLARAADDKSDAGKERKKPAELGYQGTARPAKKPVEISYKGTARPGAAATLVGKPGPAAAKPKPKSSQSRYGGYASWSDVEEEEEEDDYASDASSDMEGNLWDVEEEETKALKAAKQEDAAALAEEARLKREKEERKRKLMAMNKAAASKRKY